MDEVAAPGACSAVIVAGILARGPRGVRTDGTEDEGRGGR